MNFPEDIPDLHIMDEPNPDKVLSGNDIIKIIEKYVRDFRKTCIKILKTDKKEIQTLFVFLTPDLQIVICPPGVTNLPKEFIPEIIEKALSENPIVAMFMISEAYAPPKGAKKADIDDLYEMYKCIKDMPGSYEILSITAFYNVKGKLNSAMYHAPIVRTVTGFRDVSYKEELLDMKNNSPMSGNFVPPVHLLIPIEV